MQFCHSLKIWEPQSAGELAVLTRQPPDNLKTDHSASWGCQPMLSHYVLNSCCTTEFLKFSVWYSLIWTGSIWHLHCYGIVRAVHIYYQMQLHWKLLLSQPMYCLTQWRTCLLLGYVVKRLALAVPLYLAFLDSIRPLNVTWYPAELSTFIMWLQCSRHGGGIWWTTTLLQNKLVVLEYQHCT